MEFVSQCTAEICQQHLLKHTGLLVAMSMASLYFTSKQPSIRFPWFNCKSADTRFFKAAQQIILNEGDYRTGTSAIIKLGDADTHYLRQSWTSASRQIDPYGWIKPL
jgi:hypothetical protein